MPAEIHKQILDYQGGDANVALELVEKFKPLIKRYAFFLHREDSFEDLQCFLLSMLKTWDTSRLSSTDDATVTRYIANSVKNEYIALSKQKAKERGTSYLEDATLPQALEYAQKTSTCDQYDQLTLQDLNTIFFHLLCVSVVAIGICAFCWNQVFFAFHPSLPCNRFRQSGSCLYSFCLAPWFLPRFLMSIIFH